MRMERHRNGRKFDGIGFTEFHIICHSHLKVSGTRCREFESL
nr:MAG TPA: hypothetical protein [Caudoviricetes sp.]